MMSFVADSLGKPDSYVWGNIFAPCEMISVLDLRHCPSNVCPVISADIIWKISLSIMLRIQGLRLPSVPTTKLL